MSLNLVSQDGTHNVVKSTVLELREFDADKLESYRSDDAYSYQVYKEVEKGAFQRFLDRVWGWFKSFFGSGTAGKVMEWTFYILCFSAFVFFIFKLFGIEASALFTSGKKSTQAFEVSEESLSQINFEDEISKAETEGQWRIFIRLTYLYALKSLADRELISVKKGKTNLDYLYEISDASIKEDFSGLSFLFDYTWYGHFEATKEMADRAKMYSLVIMGKEKAA